MRARQSGFTLIELIVVIVILGILGAIAVPKFVDISGDAYDASAKASAGALSSATALNYAKVSANPATGTPITSSTVCSSLPASLMAGAALSSDNGVVFANTTVTVSCSGAGSIDKTSCMVKHTSGATSTGFPVSVICTGS